MTHLRLLSVLAVMMACATPPPPPPPAPEAPVAPRGTSIEGVVRDATDAPIAGALVALVPASLGWDGFMTPPSRRVRTSTDGRFRIEGASAGPYGLSVTAPGFVTSFRSGLRLEEARQLQVADVRLEAGGTTFQGTVKKPEGAPSSEVWVGAARLSEEQGDVAYVRADASGAWSIQLPPGNYLLYAEVPGFVGFVQPVSPGKNEGQPLELLLKPAPVETPPPVEVTEWLKQASVPLTTVEARHGFEDLRPLAPAVSKARVVALGEATHGTREFFQLKHRMLEWLATEHDFTLFGIEGNFAEALVVNDYVLTGKGDPRAALAGMHFWTWDTEEVLALIQWMRAYNADPKHPKKLKFYGFDMQYTPASTQALLDYFKKVDAAFGRTLEEPLGPLLAVETLRPGSVLAPEKLAAMQAGLAEARKRLEAQRKAYVRRSSERDHAFARRHAELLAYMVDMGERPGPERFVARDRNMAENVRWLLEQEGPDAKMVVWAHNAHVSTALALPNATLGRNLREALGDALYVFGFIFNQGSFQARVIRPGQRPGGVIIHTVPPARAGTVDAILAATGLPLLAIDLRRAPREGPVARFLEESRRSRQIGGVYGEDFPEESLILAEEYDGVLFVERTTAAIPTPTGRRPDPVPSSSKPGP